MRAVKKIAGAAAGVIFAAGLFFTSLAAVPRITFTNTDPDDVALYVTKTVTQAEGVTAPADDEFTFILSLNGAPAKEAAYVLYKDGVRVYNYGGVLTETQNPSEPESAQQTDRHGAFSIKAGYTAAFVGLAEGVEYEVTEEAAAGYTQILPAGGASASGVLTDKGAEAKFTNRYSTPVKAVDLLAEEELTTTLTVRKDISFPDGYENPDAGSFTFLLQIDNSAWAGEKYQIIDNETEKSVGSGRTTSSGEFTIAGGQSAVFEDVPADHDYSVEEKDQDGWHAVGEKTVSGATAYPAVEVSFANKKASIGLSKTVDGDALPGDDTFSFVLLDENGTAVKDAEYYLYDSSTKKLVDQASYHTGDAGDLAVTDGQTAIIMGLSYGHEYTVRELKKANYVQTLPEDTSGYVRTIGDSVEILPFVNEANEVTRSLYVSKQVKSLLEGVKAPALDFKFRIEKYDEEKGEYAPYANASYTLSAAGKETESKTDASGCFTLQDAQTAAFMYLKKGAKYRVCELTDTLPSRFSVSGDAAMEGTVTDANLDFVFVNLYDTPVIKKVWDDEDDILGKRPKEVKVDVIAEGETTPTQTITLNEENSWQAVVEITDNRTYRYEEQAVAGYEPTVEVKDGVITITNKYVQRISPLADTGGAGKKNYALAGALIMLFAAGISLSRRFVKR